MDNVNQRQLVSCARRRVRSQQLPDHEPEQSWGGLGNGQPCALCNRPITGSQIEYEIETATGAIGFFRFHAACSLAWRQACARRAVEPRSREPA
ncbi:MAG TPA: hypothetical protein VMF03_07280 [Steroidobacteraceae bacterium]|nr:hypothetical protein [Steroidobacteraceae bacterium]